MSTKKAIQPATSLQPAFTGYIERVIGPIAAAKILTRNLGRDRSAWIKFLRKDRDPRNKNQWIAWRRHGGLPLYAEVDVYAYVQKQKPNALWRNDPVVDPLDDSNLNMWASHVYGDIEFEDGPRAVVYVEVTGDAGRNRGMTPKAARELAKDLLVAADRCEEDTPAAILRRLGSGSRAFKTGSASYAEAVALAKAAYEKAMADAAKPAGSPAHTTGDPELDALLADLT